MSLDLYIARHGQDEDNANGILNGRRDTRLTELGKRQASDLGKGMLDLNISFDVVYSSPLDRALETAKIVSDILNIHKEPTVIEDLIERKFGVTTGKPASEIERLCSPNIIKTDTITYFLDPEGAETFPQLVDRGQKVLEYVRKKSAAGSILLVCHGDIGKLIYAAATKSYWGDVLRGFNFGNGDLIEVSNNNEVHKIKLPQHDL